MPTVPTNPRDPTGLPTHPAGRVAPATRRVVLATPVLLALFPVLSLWRRNFDEVGYAGVAGTAFWF